MIAGSGDTAAAARGRGDGRFRASRGEREQVVELLKTAFVDERLTREELDARVGQALASRTHADLAALTADIPAGPAGIAAGPAGIAARPTSIPAGPTVSSPPREAAGAPSQPPVKYVARHAVTATPKTGTARVGGAVAVAAKLMLVLWLVTSIPPLFLLLVAVCVVAVIVAVAWIRT